MSRPLDTAWDDAFYIGGATSSWTETTRENKHQWEFRLKLKRPEDYRPRFMHLQTVNNYDSDYGRKVMDMDFYVQTSWSG